VVAGPRQKHKTCTRSTLGGIFANASDIRGSSVTRNRGLLRHHISVWDALFPPCVFTFWFTLSSSLSGRTLLVGRVATSARCLRRIARKLVTLRARIATSFLGVLA
jgi:hypothetical protein